MYKMYRWYWDRGPENKSYWYVEELQAGEVTFAAFDKDLVEAAQKCGLTFSKIFIYAPAVFIQSGEHVPWDSVKNEESDRLLHEHLETELNAK